MFEKYPDIVKVEQVADMLGICKAMVYSLLNDNMICHVRVGRRYIIPKTAVVAFVNNACYNDNRIVSGGLHLVEKGGLE